MRILIFSVSLILSLQCYGQYHIGIGTNISSSRLNSISKKVIHSYGFSGADFDQKLNFEVSPYLQVRMTLKNNLGFELGIGYSTIKHKIELDYYYSFFQKQVNKTLDIKLNYISLPISLLYGIKVSERSKLILSSSLVPKFLVRYKDNFQKIIFEEIGLPINKYNKRTFEGSFSIGIQRQLVKNNIIELNLFAGKDFNPLNKMRWGFYSNLYPARNVQFGVGLKYFFISF